MMHICRIPMTCTGCINHQNTVTFKDGLNPWFFLYLYCHTTLSFFSLSYCTALLFDPLNSIDIGNLKEMGFSEIWNKETLNFSSVTILIFFHKHIFAQRKLFPVVKVLELFLRVHSVFRNPIRDLPYCVKFDPEYQLSNTENCCCIWSNSGCNHMSSHSYCQMFTAAAKSFHVKCWWWI